MPSNVPQIGQAFSVYMTFKDYAGLTINPTFASNDVRVFAGTADATGTSVTPTQVGALDLYYVTVTAGMHTASPIGIFVEDQAGAAFQSYNLTFHSLPQTKLKYDGSYIRETNTADVVQRHWSAGLVGGVLVIGAAVEGDVP